MLRQFKISLFQRRISEIVAICMEELENAVDNGILTQIQVEIVRNRLNGMKYSELRTNYGISCNTALQHCFLRTAFGRRWEKHIKGGPNFYLSDIDMNYFEEIIRRGTYNLNCLTTNRTKLLAHSLCTARYNRGVKLLIRMNCEKLVSQQLPPEPPCKTWLYHYVSKIGFKLCRPEMLELARRRFCDDEAIEHFFLEFGS
jgi:hypothetical protein